MKPPIEGMKTMPLYADDELMMGAWVDCVNYCITEEHRLLEFKQDTGIDMMGLVGCSPFEQMIDKATGRDKEYILRFCDWVTKNVWGEKE